MEPILVVRSLVFYINGSKTIQRSETSQRVIAYRLIRSEIETRMVLHYAVKESSTESPSMIQE